MNSVLYEAEGISHYNALQLQVRKRFSKGLQLTASYTWSHALDEQSGLGLFFTGNNPLYPKSNYASSDFDRTHVFLVNYSYTIPKFTSHKLVNNIAGGWIIGGQTVAQSGEPYIHFQSDRAAETRRDREAELQGTTGINAGQPVLNENDFAPQFVAPGQDGVPSCTSWGQCDNYESGWGSTGRRSAVPGFCSFRCTCRSEGAFPLVGCTEQVIARDRHYYADYCYDSNDDPAPRNRAHYCALAALEVPKLLVRVTLTEATSAAFPETVNGMVSRNSVP
jgi:hypothetical protein